MTTAPVTPAHGEHTDNGRPKGFSSLTPFVALEDPKAALAFYTDVFGARVVSSTEMEGMVIHAELDFGCGRLQLGPAMEDYHLLALDPEAEDAQFGDHIKVLDPPEAVQRIHDLAHQLMQAHNPAGSINVSGQYMPRRSTKLLCSLKRGRSPRKA